MELDVTRQTARSTIIVSPDTLTICNVPMELDLTPSADSVATESPVLQEVKETERIKIDHGKLIFTFLTTSSCFRASQSQ